MNIFSLARRYLTASISTTLLQILTFSTGIAILFITFNISSQIVGNFSQGKSRADVVVGAKGSPLQLVLSSIYHADIPTGNINYRDAMRLSRHNSVKNAVPISLGDSYKGHRIVGTTKEFLKFYNVKITDDIGWVKPMEAIIGYHVAKKFGLKIGDNFVGSHGLALSADEHDHAPYKIVGVIEKNNNIIDRLIIVDLQSVWDIHDLEDHHGEDHGHHKENEHHDDHDNHDVILDDNLEITALLLKYKNRAAVINFPRMVNQKTNMQAATPSFEISKLFKILGVGFNAAKIIAYILLSISVLGIFLILLSNVQKRRYDMAMLRVFGASPPKIMSLVIIEAMMITLVGLFLGFVFSRLVLFVIMSVNIFGSVSFSVDSLLLTNSEIYIILIVSFVALLASIIPAIMTYRVNIVDLLLKN